MTELEAVSGVGPGAAKKLKEAFITTAELLAVQNPVELQKKTKLGEGTVTKLIRNAREVVGMLGFKSGLEIERELHTKPRLKTGIDSVDEKLFGGIPAGSIVEYYGPARGGKTQWAAQLAVRVQLPIEEGGLEGRVLWLDSESSFRPNTIRANAVRWGLDPDIALGNIGYSKIVMSAQIIDIFDSIPRMCAEENYKLVIVDSFTGLFRVEYTGLANLKVRQQDINNILNIMRRTGTATDTVFAYTNQVMASISKFGGVPNAPIGGHILSHGSDFRFYTRRKKDDIRILQLEDNAGLPEFKIELHVGWGGLYHDTDIKKKTESNVEKYFEKRGWSTIVEEPLDEVADEVVEEGVEAV
ncbi:MAG: DNA repair and recombination protein RadA [Candidatus Thorarchaeota archaeon]